MMQPIPCVWTGEAFIPRGNLKALVAEHYGEGEVVALEPVEERSSKSHAHYFACVGAAWQTLPDEAMDRFPTASHLRKYALIKAGYRDERSIACSSRAEALRLAAFIKPMDEYAIVTVAGSAVTVHTAKSQSVKAMGSKVFQESKDAVFAVLADLLGVEPTALRKAA